MKKEKEFPFESARRITDKEVQKARKAIEAKVGLKRPNRGRPPSGNEKYEPISIRLHPKVLIWAKKEAKKRRIGYQTIINEILPKIILQTRSKLKCIPFDFDKFISPPEIKNETLWYQKKK